MISSENNNNKKSISSTPLSNFSLDDCLIGPGIKERQKQRNKQAAREGKVETERAHLHLWEMTYDRDPSLISLRVNVKGLENSWHSFRHCTPSAYHHQTLHNGNDTEYHMRSLKECLCISVVLLRACTYVSGFKHCCNPVSVVGSTGLSNRFLILAVYLPWPALTL